MKRSYRAAAFGIIVLAVACYAQDRVPPVPQFEPPPFDGARAVQAVGTLLPTGGSAVATMHRGVLVTAYHVIRRCVVALRRDPTWGKRFRADGAYFGDQGPLPCEGITVRFQPLGAATSAAAPEYPVFLLAVPAADRVTAFHWFDLPFRAGADGESRAQPTLDIALLHIEGNAPMTVALASHGPAVGQPVWAAGHYQLDRSLLNDPWSRFSLASARYSLRTQALLYDALATAATDLAAGVAKARAGVADSTSRANRIQPPIEERNDVDLRDLRRVASGETEVLAVTRERLIEHAKFLEEMAARDDSELELIAQLNKQVANLRALAGGGRGQEVGAVMASLRDESTVGAAQYERDMVASDAIPASSQAGVLVSSGRVTYVGNTTARASSFIGQGMSGGAVFDANGEVLGVIVASRGRTAYYDPDNLVFVPADVVRGEFATFLR